MRYQNTEQKFENPPHGSVVDVSGTACLFLDVPGARKGIWLSERKALVTLENLDKIRGFLAEVDAKRKAAVAAKPDVAAPAVAEALQKTTSENDELKRQIKELLAIAKQNLAGAMAGTKESTSVIKVPALTVERFNPVNA